MLLSQPAKPGFGRRVVNWWLTMRLRYARKREAKGTLSMRKTPEPRQSFVWEGTQTETNPMDERGIEKIKQRKNGKVVVDELNTVNDLPLNWDGFLRTQKMTIIDRRTITTAPDVAASITTKVATFRWRRTDMSILSSPKAFHAEQLYSPKSSSLAWCITSKLRSPSVSGSAKKNERMRQTFRESQSW